MDIKLSLVKNTENTDYIWTQTEISQLCPDSTSWIQLPQEEFYPSNETETLTSLSVPAKQNIWSLSKPQKLCTDAKPFKPSTRPNTNTMNVSTSDITVKKIPVEEVKTEKQLHPLFKLVQKQLLSDDHNKENISRPSPVTSLLKEECKDSVPKILYKYDLSDLLNIYKGMGNFTNHSFSEDQLQAKPKLKFILSVNKPKYTLEQEYNTNLDPFSNPTFTFLDELDAELKHIGRFSNIYERHDDEESESCRD